MPAETAVAPDATGANQSQEIGAATLQEPPAHQAGEQRLEVPIGDRAAELEMLEINGAPAEILERARQGVEKEKAESGKLTAEIGQQQPPTPPAKGPAGEQHEELTPEQRANTDPKLIARIDKLTGRIRGDLEPKLAEKDAEIARLKADLEKKPAAPGEPGKAAETPKVPYGNVTDEAGIAEQVRIAREIRDWATLNIEGAFEVPWIGEDGKQTVRDVPKEEVRKMLVDANRALETHLPNRRQQLQQERQQTENDRKADEFRPKYEELIQEEYPDLKDPESDLAKHVEILVNAYPMLKGSPDGRLVAADIVSKTLARRDKLVKAGLIDPPANGSAAPAATLDPKVAPFIAPKPPRAPAVPSTANGAPPPPAADAEADKAREDYLNSPRTDEDYQTFVDRLSASQAAGGVRGNAPARV